ncbi:MAG: phosphonate C-P lyase system protein PhnG [Zoogloeaceae bacterium]|jgi:alpha-D-ribose 1-methylphosphonate 5-triphosphate synthase subunit PhnG|nr:phosphonate C-P lyase system protein PhnG [Zoogloeaceae bacterium]
MNTHEPPSPKALPPEIQARQQWMYTLAHADIADLLPFAAKLKAASHQFIRPPEIGMVLVRGRMGATGAPFNLGEMTVTRCVVRNDENCVGYSYIAGRDKTHAELAALADAHLQGARHRSWVRQIVESLDALRQSRQAEAARRLAGTRVDFFTLLRGENDAG